MLSFAQLDLAIKNALEVTAYISSVDRYKAEMDCGNTRGMLLIIAVNYIKISLPNTTVFCSLLRCGNT